MTKIVVAVRDLKGSFYDPRVCNSEELAKRDFITMFRDTGLDQSLPQLYPQDFALFRLGTFDSDVGEFQCEQVPIMLINGLQAVDYWKLNNFSEEVF